MVWGGGCEGRHGADRALRDAGSTRVELTGMGVGGHRIGGVDRLVRREAGIGRKDCLEEAEFCGRRGLLGGGFGMVFREGMSEESEGFPSGLSLVTVITVDEERIRACDSGWG
ncbi:hypothetical protein Tco_0018380 [Tanacetum coccineum]